MLLAEWLLVQKWTSDGEAVDVGNACVPELVRGSINHNTHHLICYLIMQVRNLIAIVFCFMLKLSTVV
jgi:hypothetical protein